MLPLLIIRRQLAPRSAAAIFPLDIQPRNGLAKRPENRPTVSPSHTRTSKCHRKTTTAEAAAGTIPRSSLITPITASRVVASSRIIPLSNSRTTASSRPTVNKEATGTASRTPTRYVRDIRPLMHVANPSVSSRTTPPNLPRTKATTPLPAATRGALPSKTTAAPSSPTTRHLLPASRATALPPGATTTAGTRPSRASTRTRTQTTVAGSRATAAARPAATIRASRASRARSVLTASEASAPRWWEEALRRGPRTRLVVACWPVLVPLLPVRLAPMCWKTSSRSEYLPSTRPVQGSC